MFDAALVGGPDAPGLPGAVLACRRRRSPWDTTRSTTTTLPPGPCIWRQVTNSCSGLPPAPYFLAVCRLVPEKNLIRLIKAYSRYRVGVIRTQPGVSLSAETVQFWASLSGWSQRAAQGRRFTAPVFFSLNRWRWYAHAGAFVLPSVSEPWGLVVNEAAASGLPLLVSSRAGCAPILVPAPRGTTGSQFDPLDVNAISDNLTWMASRPLKSDLKWVNERWKPSLTGHHLVLRRAFWRPSISPKDRFAYIAVLEYQVPRRDKFMTNTESEYSKPPCALNAAIVDSRPSSGSGRWLHLCNGLDPVRDGGMVPSILGMTGALARICDAVTIVTPTPSRLDAGTLAAGLTLKGPETNLEKSVRAADVVHLHGLWQSQTRLGAHAARAAHIPYLIAAHGMAEPWALRKALEEAGLSGLGGSAKLRQASCLHALSRPEIDHLRRIAPWTPICFIPNGVNLTLFDDLPSRSELESKCPELVGKFVLLFFARVHVKKGLDLLAEALSRIAPGYPELHLVIAGNDDGALSSFRDRMAELGLTRR